MFHLTVVAAFLVCAQGAVFLRPPVPKLDGKIVGGVPTDITDAPYQVAALLDYWGIGSFTQFCGGSIISPTVVVTAAHCTYGTTNIKWKIRAGSTYHNSGGQVIAVSSIVQHPGFTSRLDNDISLLFLATPLTMGVGVAIINLPYQNQVVADGTMALVTGWGYLKENGVHPSNLYKVTIPIINQQMCVDAYAKVNTVTSNMICAGLYGVGGEDACQGDSGGPMVIADTLIGITSWGEGCGEAQFPGVWTRVAAFSTWINSNI